MRRKQAREEKESERERARSKIRKRRYKKNLCEMNNMRQQSK